MLERATVVRAIRPTKLRGTSRALAAGGLVLLIGAPPAGAGVQCDAGKLKCVGKRNSCLLEVEGNALKQAIAVDGARVQQCQDEFDGGPDPSRGCIMKLEAKQNPAKPATLCSAVGDAATLAVKVDAFIDDLLADVALDYPSLEPPNTCHAGLVKCAKKKALCILKAQTTGMKKGFIEVVRLQRCFGKFYDPVFARGCVDKVYAKQEPGKPATLCDVPFDGASLEAEVDAFAADLVASALNLTVAIDSTGDGVHGFFDPVGLAVDGADNVFVAGGDRAFKITPGGAITQIIDFTGDSMGNQLSGARRIVTDGGGNVFVSGASHNVFKITPGGTISEILDLAGVGTVADLAADPAGNLFVADGFNNEVLQVTPGGVTTVIIDASGDGVNGLTAVAVATDAAGNVFAGGGTFVDSRAFKIATPGTCSTTGTPCAITEIIGPSGDGANPLQNLDAIATDAAGNVYTHGGFAADGSVFVITPGGAITRIISSGHFGAPIFYDLAPGKGLHVEADGDVYVYGRDNVYRLASDGTVAQLMSSFGNGTRRLDGPTDVVVDGAGRVYVAGDGLPSEDLVFRLSPP